MKNAENTITYIEFPAADRERLYAAQAFYGAAFGWHYQNWGDEYRDTDASGVGSGLCVSDATAPLAVIYSADLETAYNAVITAGGTIVQEIFSFPGGRRFHFRDPAGNILAVWSDKGVQSAEVA